MLTFGILAFLWLLLSVIPVVVFYFLRMHFRQQPVSSTYIWNKFKDLLSTGNRLKWRTVLLLVLQILAVIFLILALTKPSFLTGINKEQGTCFILDVSASMGATDVASSKDGIRTRLDLAKSLLSGEIAKLPENTDVMIFLCASYAKQLADITSNKAMLIDKLKAVKTTDDEFRESEASSVISVWLSKVKRKFDFVIFTDGGMDLRGRRISDALNSPVRTVYTGADGVNIGISGLRFVNILPGVSYQAQFFTRNSFKTDKRVNVLLKGGKDVISSTELDLSPGLAKNIIEVPGELKDGSYSIEIADNDDNLEIDDRCFLSVNPKPRIKILVVGRENPFINAALSYSNIYFSTSDKFPQGSLSENWDIIIANYIKIPGDMKNNLLSFGEIPENSPLKYDRMTGGVLKRYDSNHPLLRYVDWENTRVSRSLSLSVNTGINVLATVEGRPVMAAWERGGYKFAACTIDILDSDIGLSGSFPIFLQNFISWCVPQNDSQLKYTFDAGDHVVRYESPSWKVTGKKFIDYRHVGNRISMTSLSAGIYEWENSELKGTLSVNVPVGESDISPRKVFERNMRFNMVNDALIVKIPVEKIPAIIFIILLIAEWFLWIGLPFKKRS